MRLSRPFIFALLLVSSPADGELLTRTSGQTVPADQFVFPHYVVAPLADRWGYDTQITLYSQSDLEVEITIHPDGPMAVIHVAKLDGLAFQRLKVSSLLKIDVRTQSNFAPSTGWIQAKAPKPFSMTVQLVRFARTSSILIFVTTSEITHLEPASPFHEVVLPWDGGGAGIAVLNTESVERPVFFRVEASGQIVSSKTFVLGSGKRFVRFLHEVFPDINPGLSAIVRVTSGGGPMRIVAVRVERVLVDAERSLALPFSTLPASITLLKETR